MALDRTWEEPSPKRARTVALLVLVLDYDDLLAGAAAVFRLDALRFPLILGRAADDRPAGPRSPTELRLPDRWASSTHATIERRGEGHLLRDGGSRNGTRVNGARIAERPLVDGDLVEIGHSLLCYRQVEETLAAGLEEAAPVGPTPTRCPELAALRRNLARIAPSPESVLILAETGAGKESTAEAIHALSGRPGDFCPVDCGAIPDSLFEATFFGHRRGAFTGAAEARAGEVVRAHRGTLFLDEVGNLSPTAQAKLLRVIEDGSVQALGAAERQTVDVRWVAATNRDLFQDGGDGFRPDLLRRLTGFVARLPPLRRRREDLGTLSAYLLREAGARKASITAAAGRALFNGDFPGNVRQLRAALRSALLLAGDEPIDLAHLPASDLSAPPTDGEPAIATAAPVAPEAKSSPKGPPDRAAIEAALVEAGGNVVQAARRLDTHARQLYRWIERFAIPLDRYR